MRQVQWIKWPNFVPAKNGDFNWMLNRSFRNNYAAAIIHIIFLIFVFVTTAFSDIYNVPAA